MDLSLAPPIYTLYLYTQNDASIIFFNVLTCYLSVLHIFFIIFCASISNCIVFCSLVEILFVKHY